MRAVIDANVLLSGLIWRGPPPAYSHQQGFKRVSCVGQFPGTYDRTGRRYYPRKVSDPDCRLEYRPTTDAGGNAASGKDRRSTATAKADKPDKDDDAALALAAAARPDIIISGDLDLLTLGSFAVIPIVTPADALARIDAATSRN